MTRPKAGHGWTIRYRKGKQPIHFIFSPVSGWITSGEAQGWRRCPRCRKPFEVDPFESGLCIHCYFYKSSLPVSEFWRIHESGYPYAPYNIGRRFLYSTHGPLLTKRERATEAGNDIRRVT